MKLSMQSRLLVYIMTIFILCLSLTPQAFILNNKTYFNGNLSDALASEKASVYHIDYNPIQAGFLDNEIIIHLLGVRSFICNSLRSFYEGADVLLVSSISMLTSAFTFLLAFRKSKNNVSVLALSIGGHAPPMLQA